MKNYTLKALDKELNTLQGQTNVCAINRNEALKIARQITPKYLGFVLTIQTEKERMEIERRFLEMELN